MKLTLEVNLTEAEYSILKDISSANRLRNLESGTDLPDTPEKLFAVYGKHHIAGMNEPTPDPKALSVVLQPYLTEADEINWGNFTQ